MAPDIPIPRGDVRSPDGPRDATISMASVTALGSGPAPLGLLDSLAGGPIGSLERLRTIFTTTASWELRVGEHQFPLLVEEDKRLLAEIILGLFPYSQQ